MALDHKAKFFGLCLGVETVALALPQHRRSQGQYEQWIYHYTEEALHATQVFHIWARNSVVCCIFLQLPFLSVHKLISNLVIYTVVYISVIPCTTLTFRCGLKTCSSGIEIRGFGIVNILEPRTMASTVVDSASSTM